MDPTCPEPFVDIHCHLLPAIDDGAADWNESLAMARMAFDDGIETVICTPHQSASFTANLGPAVRERTRRLQQRLTDEGLRLRVLPGADVRIEPELVKRIRDDEIVTLADRRRHVLLELPHEIYIPLDRLLGDLEAAGMSAVLSHPERNQGILEQPRLADYLVDRGCLLQVTAGSLVGTFGPRVQALAERLVTRGLVHFLATDAHGTKARRPLLRRAYQRVVELAGPEMGHQLCSAAGAAVTAGKRVAKGVRPTRAAPRAWFAWRKAG
jgi:protein-tyrosine phosphatase